VLKRLVRANIALGIVSNCQPYTRRELNRALASAGLRWTLFMRPLCFLSFEHGFSKPDPHVFRLLTARLAAMGIAPAEALVVGDREDHDIEPARRQGFQIWHLTGWGRGFASGNWHQLGERLRRH
jgi:FMN phosphatase YigB (HAD superfamily)